MQKYEMKAGNLFPGRFFLPLGIIFYCFVVVVTPLTELHLEHQHDRESLFSPHNSTALRGKTILFIHELLFTHFDNKTDCSQSASARSLFGSIFSQAFRLKTIEISGSSDMHEGGLCTNSSRVSYVRSADTHLEKAASSGSYVCLCMDSSPPLA